MPVPSLSQVQQLIQGNALLRAAIREGSIQVIYREPPVISADRMGATWAVDVLILDPTISDLVAKAVARLGFEVRRNGDTLRCVREWALTDADRAEMAAADRANAQQQQQAEQTRTIAELQAQVEALRDELQLLALLPARKGAPGPAGEPGEPGPAGRDGKDGRDLDATGARLSDLKDVSTEPPNQGWVLTWSDASDQWEPKPPRMGIASMGGGAGGVSLLGDLENVAISAPTAGQLLSYDPLAEQWVNTDAPPVGLQFWHEDAQGNLIPNGGNGTKSIGSRGKEVKEIWLTGGTCYLDGFPLSVTNQGRITFDGNLLAYGSADVPVDADGGLITLP